MADPSAFEIETVAGCYDLGCWTLCNGTGFNHAVQQSYSSMFDWEEFKYSMIVSLWVLCLLVACYLIYFHCCELMGIVVSEVIKLDCYLVSDPSHLGWVTVPFNSLSS